MVNTGLTPGAEAVYFVPVTSRHDPSRSWYSAPVPRGLSGAEATAVEAGLDAVPGAWCALRHEDEAGEVSVVLVPEGDAAADAAPTSVVHREGALLRLDVCRGDTYARLGAYAAVAPLMRALAAALAGAPAGR